MAALTPSHTTATSHSSTSPGQSSDKPPNPILNHSPTPWTTDKDKKLLKCVADEKSFEDLAAELGNRSVDDCLKHWDEHLRSTVVEGQRDRSFDSVELLAFVKVLSINSLYDHMFQRCRQAYIDWIVWGRILRGNIVELYLVAMG
ncbi:hypothetical protein OEA41_000426 [Lepraria neglecta]|uniref:Myb-like domain-containing protein n=1 Tax=Lepraria neglecta TaxID=209136 RepID=A0AAD9ZGJ1_9LECA|nr:hypothetical protein OEA41_000426 [Lepraria neglecta]